MEIIISLKEVQGESAGVVKCYVLAIVYFFKNAWHLGDDRYALVATVSKKMCNAHEEEFDNVERSYTTYYAAIALVETAKYFNEEFCNSLDKKDKLFTAAAVNGNVHILRLFSFHLYAARQCDMIPSNIDDTFEIVARGNLHVLDYLKDQFETYSWLQKYCFPAIQYGQMEILKWLKSMVSDI